MLMAFTKLRVFTYVFRTRRYFWTTSVTVICTTRMGHVVLSLKNQRFYSSSLRSYLYSGKIVIAYSCTWNSTLLTEAILRRCKGLRWTGDILKGYIHIQPEHSHTKISDQQFSNSYAVQSWKITANPLIPFYHETIFKSCVRYFFKTVFVCQLTCNWNKHILCLWCKELIK